MSGRGYLWTHLAEEVVEKFRQLAEPVPLAEQACRARAVAAEVRYHQWSSRELDRLPEQLRQQVEHLARSSGARAAAKQRETERQAALALEPRVRKKSKPRVAPALTKYQRDHLKRKAMRMKTVEKKPPTRHLSASMTLDDFSHITRCGQSVKEEHIVEAAMQSDCDACRSKMLVAPVAATGVAQPPVYGAEPYAGAESALAVKQALVDGRGPAKRRK